MTNNPIDKHIGERIRYRRILLGLSQQRLAQQIGLTFQQIQKYEKGVNRISASRLLEIAMVLGVPINYFFADMEGDAGDGIAARPAPCGPDLPPAEMERFGDGTGRETLELVRAYYGVKDRTTRKRLLSMMRAIGESEKRPQ